MQAFGIWCDESAGFVAGPEYGREAARQMLYEAIQGHRDDTLTLVEMCPEHVNEEQRADACEICE